MMGIPRSLTTLVPCATILPISRVGSSLFLTMRSESLQFGSAMPSFLELHRAVLYLSQRQDLSSWRPGG